MIEAEVTRRKEAHRSSRHQSHRWAQAALYRFVEREYTFQSQGCKFAVLVNAALFFILLKLKRSLSSLRQQSTYSQ
jgi:hypothetical protein